VLAVAMRGRKQVMGNFSAGHNGAFGVGQFHEKLFSYLYVFPMRGQVSEFAFDFFAMRRVCAENWAASIPCAGATGQFGLGAGG
jgi:hypothetical protein